MTLQAEAPRLVLASQSPFRAALLAAAGITFEARAAHIDESEVKRSGRAENASPDDVALLLAELKARRVARGNTDAVVIGADQLLVCEDRWFDKPTSREDARAQLEALRGRPHTLVTAVLCMTGEQRLWHHVARPRLVMRQFSDAFLDAYLDIEGDRVTTTVGGYRLEGLGVQLFDSMSGEQSAIIGLPMLPLLGFLRQHLVLIS